MNQNKKIFTLTNIIIFLNFVAFGAQQLIPNLTVVLGLNSLLIQEKFYFQLFSTMFMHGNLMHILFIINTYFILIYLSRYNISNLKLNRLKI